MLNEAIIGQRISAARKLKKISQVQLAETLGVSGQAVSKWERGESLPDILTLDKLAQLFGTSLNYFSDGDFAMAGRQESITANKTLQAPDMQSFAADPGSVFEINIEEISHLFSSLQKTANMQDLDQLKKLIFYIDSRLNTAQQNTFGGIRQGETQTAAPPPLPPQTHTEPAVQKKIADVSILDWKDENFSSLKQLGQKFSFSNVLSCKFNGSDLSKIRLKSNNLCDSEFLRANLDGSMFTNCTITNNHFDSATVKLSDFKGTTVKNCGFTGADFTGSMFSASHFSDCDLSGANFSNTKFNTSTMRNSALNKAVFFATEFTGTLFENMLFENNMTDCSFANCVFRRSEFKNVTFINCFFKGAPMNSAYMQKVKFTGCRADRLSYEFLRSCKADLSDIEKLAERYL